MEKQGADAHGSLEFRVAKRRSECVRTGRFPVTLIRAVGAAPRSGTATADVFEEKRRGKLKLKGKVVACVCRALFDFFGFWVESGCPSKNLSAMDRLNSQRRALSRGSQVERTLRREREHYFRASELLHGMGSSVPAYFPDSCSTVLRTITLKEPVSHAPFYSEAIAMSSGNFPDFVHLARSLYLDVIRCYDEIAVRDVVPRTGARHKWRFSAYDTPTLCTRLRESRSWIAIPLEAQAYHWTPICHDLLQIHFSV